MIVIRPEAAWLDTVDSMEFATQYKCSSIEVAVTFDIFAFVKMTPMTQKVIAKLRHHDGAIARNSVASAKENLLRHLHTVHLID